MASDTWIELPAYGSPFWKSPVANSGSLPALGNTIGDVRLALDTDTIFVWNGTSWIAVATPGAAIALDGLIGDVTASGPGVATASFTATTNSTLTTLSALSLPTSQLSGQINLRTQVSNILQITNGGTGSSDGGISGSGGLVFSAGGTGNNVSLIPSAGGNVLLTPNVGIGTSTPASVLDVLDSTTEGLSIIANFNAPNANDGVIKVSGLSQIQLVMLVSEILLRPIH
jgi:hypothetical protein